MAKKETKKDAEKESFNPAQQALAYLKKNKDDHYNFEETYEYIIPSSSLKLNTHVPLNNAAHRFLGPTGSGKSSAALDYMFNFLKQDNCFGCYVKSEGRLSKQIRERSGVNFTFDPKNWNPGSCFVFESNVYEAVFGFIGELIKNNPNKAKYYFIIDSMDMMGKREDLAKPLEDAGQVAGGALLTSVFLKKTSVALSKRGHNMVFISQIRESIKINQYAKTPPKQGQSSGGHAIAHAGDVVFDFQNVNQQDYIYEDPKDKNSPILGHNCRVKVLKSNNETRNQEISYPIKYGRSDGKSVWVEKEVIDMCLSWSLIIKKSAWFSWDEDTLQELEKALDIEVEKQFQGMKNLNDYFENNENITNYFVEKFRSMIN